MKWLVVFSIALSSVAAAEANDATWHRVVGLLQYLEGDYPLASASGDTAELAEQRGFADEVVQALAGDARYLTSARAIEASIDGGKPAIEVSAQEFLVHGLTRSGALATIDSEMSRRVNACEATV